MDAHAPPDAPPSGPKWPTVVGILSLVVGFLSGSCCAPIGCIQNRLTVLGYWDMLESVWPPWYFVVVAVSMVLAGGASLCLLAGGALLISRRRIARRLHLVYAWVTLGLGVADALVVWVGLGISGIPDDLYGFMSLGAAVALIWALVYPVFVLFWFARATVRADVATWER